MNNLKLRIENESLCEDCIDSLVTWNSANEIRIRVSIKRGKSIVLCKELFTL